MSTIRHGTTGVYTRSSPVSPNNFVCINAGETPEEIQAGYPHLTLAQISAAVSYYHANREEIDSAIQRDRDAFRTLRAKGGKDAKTGYVLDGDYFGLPWPCYGTPELKHPGSPQRLVFYKRKAM